MSTVSRANKNVFVPKGQRTLLDVQKGSIVRERSLNRPMSEIGRMNNDNSKATIDSVVKGLLAAISRYKVPAVVAVAASKRSKHDLAIWPRPGALIRKTPIDCIHWTNTFKRSNALFFSREFNGWRAWPQYRADNLLGITKLADDIGGQAWVAIATRATSADSSLLCRWIPQPDLMNYYVRGASIPAVALFGYPAAPWDAKNKRFDVSAELLATILGMKPGVAA